MPIFAKSWWNHSENLKEKKIIITLKNEWLSINNDVENNYEKIQAFLHLLQKISYEKKLGKQIIYPMMRELMEEIQNITYSELLKCIEKKALITKNLRNASPQNVQLQNGASVEVLSNVNFEISELTNLLRILNNATSRPRVAPFSHTEWLLPVITSSLTLIAGMGIWALFGPSNHDFKLTNDLSKNGSTTLSKQQKNTGRKRSSSDPVLTRFDSTASMNRHGLPKMTIQQKKDREKQQKKK